MDSTGILFLIKFSLILLHTHLGNACTPEPRDLINLNLRLYNNTYSGGDDILVSDLNLQPSWYRAVHNGRQYLLSDSSTTTYEYTMCGTYYPVYLRDPHPAIDDLTSAGTEVEACLYDFLYPCDVKYQIKIRVCGDDVKEIQYYLVSTVIYSGFCLEYGEQIINPPSPPPEPELGDVTVSPAFHFIDIPVPPFEHVPKLDFQCSFNVEDGLFYTVDWYIDGQYFTTYGPTNIITDLVLEEDTLVENNIVLGITLQCSVTASADADGLQTDPVNSLEFYAGVKLENNNIYLKKEEGIGHIQMKFTVPIGCRYTTGNEALLCKTHITVNNKDTDGQQCVADIVNWHGDANECTKPITTLTKTATFNPDQTYTFDVASTDFNYNDRNLFNLILQFKDDIRHRVWKNYIFPQVFVHVEDSLTYQGKTCQSHIDPHMKTSDGNNYEQQTEGEFRMYRNTVTDIEVQEKTIQCNNVATCACAVAVRAGRDVFMVNKCGSINYIDFVQCGEGGILDVLEIDSNHYTIRTPTGTIVNVYLRGGQWINIDIIMAPKDVENTEGLCGYFDGNPYNDFKHSDDQQTARDGDPTSFSKSWRLDEDSGLLNMSLFRTAPRTLDSWISRNNLYCICNRTYAEKECDTEQCGSVYCSPSQYLTCNDARSITETKCRVKQGFRRRRDTRSHTKELDRLFELMQQVPYTSHHDITKRQTNDITLEEATAICADKINGSLAFTSYSDLIASEDPNIVIEQCAYDIDVGDDTMWAGEHVAAVNSIVKSMIDKQPMYVANHTEEVEVFLQNTCLNNCTGNGNCTTQENMPRTSEAVRLQSVTLPCRTWEHITEQLEATKGVTLTKRSIQRLCKTFVSTHSAKEIPRPGRPKITPRLSMAIMLESFNSPRP